MWRISGPPSFHLIRLVENIRAMSKLLVPTFSKGFGIRVLPGDIASRPPTVGIIIVMRSFCGSSVALQRFTIPRICVRVCVLNCTYPRNPAL